MEAASAPRRRRKHTHPGFFLLLLLLLPSSVPAFLLPQPRGARAQRQRQPPGRLQAAAATGAAAAAAAASASASAAAATTAAEAEPPPPPPTTTTTTPPQLQSVVARRLRRAPDAPTVWVEFGALAAALPPERVVNLGQGFPNWNPPQFVTAAAHAAIDQGHNQYTRTAGHPALVQLLAERYGRHFGRNVDAMGEVAVTVGASQALYLSLQSLVAPGDEVILLEPFFDLYIGQARLAGGTPVFVPLLNSNEGQWELDLTALERAVSSPKARVLVLNSPHNPTGKVFTRAEMEAIASVIERSGSPNLVVISDEVYKFTVFGAESEGHVHFASLPRMYDRTLTVSSAGKTFSVTGWQVGWVVGPSAMIRDIQVVLPYVQFCASTPMQEALTHAIHQADQPYQGAASYYQWLAQEFRRKRDTLAAALREAGIQPMESQGGFFLLGDVSGVSVPELYLRQGTPAMPVMTRDWAFCRWMTQEYGLIAIPTSAFYADAHQPSDQPPSSACMTSERRPLVRFTFCKTDATLEAAAAVLRRVGQHRQERERGEGQ